MIHARTVVRSLLLAAVLAVPAAGQVSTAPTYPGATWEAVSREDLGAYGWDATKLRGAYGFIRDSAHTTGLVVVDRGRVVFTYGDIEELSYLASARKSILAMLYGKWVENGTIDLDKTLADMGVDDIGGLLPIEKQARIQDLITARSGVYHPASNGGDDLASAPARGSQEPGTYQLYSNWDFNAAGAAFEHETGRNIYDELGEQLAGPLQFEDWDRTAQRKSGDLTVSVNPAYHMWLSTRDMARVGYLMLREGEWNGRRLISREWVDRISGVVTPLEEMHPVSRRDGYFGYGYMWWVWDGPKAVGPFEGAYTARGAIGQWITVLPAVDMVIAHKTNSVYGRTTSWESWERLIELLFEARGVEVPGSYPWG
ncbi:MAG TPA: serine hydrolase [Longimicrobiales bacterium]|nr:serine hydrolase [Longimicrobiales bacterium]